MLLLHVAVTRTAVCTYNYIYVYTDTRLPYDRKQKMARCISCSEWCHKACQDMGDSVFKGETNFCM